jgi:hypothetical protein
VCLWVAGRCGTRAEHSAPRGCAPGPGSAPCFRTSDLNQVVSASYLLLRCFEHCTKHCEVRRVHLMRKYPIMRE